VKLGKAAASADKIDKGIQRLRKALGMCFNQNKREFEREIEGQIRKAQKIKWYKEDELAQVDKQNLMSVLHEKLPAHEGQAAIFERFGKYLDSSNPASAKEQKGGVGEKHGSIPDFLLCRIKDDFMEDPVIIQSGFTFERKCIETHFKMNGAFDPITR
jgi:hypothetical protein